MPDREAIYRIELFNPLGQLVGVIEKDLIEQGKISIPSSINGYLFFMKIFMAEGYMFKKIIRY